MKAGTNAEDLPALFFPTVVGVPRRRFQDQYKDKPIKERVFVGEQAIANRHHLTITNPIDHGHIDDWEEVRIVLCSCRCSISLQHFLAFMKEPVQLVGCLLGFEFP